MPRLSNVAGLLVLPRLRVQNVNVISSPLTWGFPSITAFMGLMWNLERKVAKDYDLIFQGVGLVCHSFDPQIGSNPAEDRFNLTRNPLNRYGNPAPFVEEGRAQIEVTLVFGVDGATLKKEPDERIKIAQYIFNIVTSMRIAGGNVVPPYSTASHSHPQLIRMEQDYEKRSSQFRLLRRNWLPGFTLVSRDDLLNQRFEELRKKSKDVNLIDAWLDISRLNWRSVRTLKSNNSDKEEETIEWKPRSNQGWIVPIPVGYSALSNVYSSDEVANTRDDTTPFQFVESIYSIGQWIGPHRLNTISDLLWYHQNNSSVDVYRCCNDFSATT